MPPSALSSLSMMSKVAAAGRSVLSRSEREALLKRFDVESSEHTLLMLDMFIAALLEHERERGQEPEWYQTLLDPSAPTAARIEAASAVRSTFLTLLRSAHDPALGNKMLATATAGLAKLDYPQDLQARVLAIVPQLVPPDIELLHRYCTEGVHRTEVDDDGELVVFSRHLVQENHVLRFMLDDGKLSEPLDSFSYHALKTHSLIRDTPLPEPGPARRPDFYPGLGFPPPTHRAFYLDWQLLIFGTIIIEAFVGRPLKEICPPAPSTSP